ncbi:hypothetical protein C8J56DRAFT_1158904 [Mycena floridula]|nr:hypothetical protein C8J56DRAFT_1158904 [Mycena floridula]
MSPLSAAPITPYFLSAVPHHGQITLPDNAGQTPPPKPQTQLSTGARTVNPSSTPQANAAARTAVSNDEYDNDIPDYPPPSFLEAISTPPLSVCPSTTTLVHSFPQPRSIPSSPVEDGPASPSLSDSDSDASIEIIEMDASMPLTEEIGPSGNFQPLRGRSKTRATDEPKRRHLSLSPLRTLFPLTSKPQGLRERTLSAHPASPYSRSAPFLRSTGSLKTLASASRTDLLNLFSKGKEKSKNPEDLEPLDNWEFLYREVPSSLMTAVESVTSSPSPSSTTPSPTQISFDQLPDRISTQATRSDSTQSLSKRDKKQAPAPRKVPWRTAPRPSPVHIETPQGPVVVSVRSKNRTPASKPGPLLGSPLSVEPWIASESPIDSCIQKALETPLPPTPVDMVRPCTSRDGIQASKMHSLLVAGLDNIEESIHSPTTPTGRHHYAGRPLPRPPASRTPVDSIYAGDTESQVSTPIEPLMNCPEGLLIDLDTTPMNQIIELPAPSMDSSPIQPHVTSFSEFADLDVMVARVTDKEQRHKLDYDNLLLISEVLGDASVLPNRPSAPSAIPSRVAVDRRRVKLRLSMLENIKVDKCGICLMQFKEGISGAISPECKHIFHEACLYRWLATSGTCPMCRVPLNLMD